jgi:hypothetical protein
MTCRFELQSLLCVPKQNKLGVPKMLTTIKYLLYQNAHCKFCIFIKHLEKVPNVFWGHLICLNILLAMKKDITMPHYGHMFGFMITFPLYFTMGKGHGCVNNPKIRGVTCMAKASSKAPYFENAPHLCGLLTYLTWNYKLASPPTSLLRAHHFHTLAYGQLCHWWNKCIYISKYQFI